MVTAAERILEQALALDPSERAEVVLMILESLEPIDVEVDRLWAEEILRRMEDLEAGRVETMPWSKVRAELEAKLRPLG